MRTQWFPAPAARRLAEASAPGWATEIFECLRAANGGTLSGFFDVFAWREPGRAAFVEAKVGPDRIKPTQLRFAEIALRFRPLEEFMIVEMARPSPQRTPGDHRAAPWRARTCSLRSTGPPRPALVRTPLRYSGPGARRGGPRTM